MKYEDFIATFPYGTHDYNKSLKDEILIGKNTGTYGAPVYGANSVKGVLIEDFIKRMGLLFETNFTLSFGQIRTGNSIPIELIPAIAGYFIVPVCATTQYDPGLDAFDDTVGEMVIQGVGTNSPLLTTNPGFTNDTTPRQVKMKEDSLTQQPLCIDNLGLEVKFSEDSTIGDGEVIIYLTYKLTKKI